MSEWDAAAQDVAHGTQGQQDGSSGEWDAAAADVASFQRASAKNSVISTAQQSPDQAAKAVQTAKQYNVPFDSALQEGDYFNGKQKADQLDNAHPAVVDHMQDPKNAAVSHDDIPQLDRVARSIANTAQGEIDAQNTFKTGIQKAADSGVSTFWKYAGLPLAGIPMAYDKLTGDDLADVYFKNYIAPLDKRIEADQEQLGEPIMERVGRGFGGLAAAIPQILIGGEAEIPEYAGKMIGEIPKLGETLRNMILKGTASNAVPGTQQAVETRQKALDSGASEAQADAAASAEYMTGAGMLSMPMSAGASSRLVNAATGYASMLTASDAQQWIMNNVLPESMRSNPGFTDKLINAIPGIIGGIHSPGTGPAIMEKDTQSALDSADAHAKITEALDAVAESKTAERTPEEFKGFLQKVIGDGDMSTIYIDPKPLAEGGQLDQLARIRPDMVPGIQEALATGNDIRMDGSDFLTTFGRPENQELATAVAEHAKLDSSGMTLAEAKDHIDGMAARLEDEVKQSTQGDAEQRRAFNESTKNVESQVYDAFKASGHYQDDVAKSYAKLESRFWSLMAARDGNMTPEEAYTMKPLRTSSDVVGGIDQDTFSQLKKTIRTVYGDDPAVLGHTLLSQHDDAFSLPTSDKDTLEGVFKDIEPGMKFEQAPEDVIRTAQNSMFDSEKPENVWMVKTNHGDRARIYEGKKTVWIDVSDLEQGGGGKKIYNAVANYAHNAGKTFIGDPAGLSDVAMHRRLENMISSSLKFGTTDHLWPHARQSEGSPTVPPIKWKDGDHAHNLREMIHASYESVKKQFPKIEHLSYNPETHSFEDTRSGNEFTDSDFADLAKSGRRVSARTDGGVEQDTGRDSVARSATEGSRTLKRAVLTHAILRATGEERSKLLAELGRIGTESRTSALDGIYYQSAKNTADITQTPEFKKWFDDSKVVDADGKPLVVYHGTNQSFDSFDKSRNGQNTKSSSSIAFFFTEHPAEASEYAELASRTQVADAVNVEKKSKKLQRKIEKAESKGYWDLAEKLYLELENNEIGAINADPSGHNLVPVYLSAKNIKTLDMNGSFDGHDVANEIKSAKKQGYDGIKLENVFDPVSLKDREGFKDTTQWIVFKPEQIKSAIGNRGTFDPNDPNILHQNDDQVRGSYRPATGDMNFTPGANLSTPFHEMGHRLFDIHSGFAKQYVDRLANGDNLKEGQKEILHDFDTILRHIGVDGKTVADRVNNWTAMDVEGQRAGHEQVASWMEHYFMTGEAPSKELHPVLSRIATWFLNAYGSMANFLRMHETHPTSDDIKAVMSRWFAARDEIAMAEHARNMFPLFDHLSDKEAEKYGIDKTQYQQENNAATASAVASLAEKSVKDLAIVNRKLAEKQKILDRLDRQREPYREEAKKELASTPVYRAIKYLRDGVLGDAKPKDLIDPRLGKPIVQSALRNMLEMAGWAQEGGQLISGAERDHHGGGDLNIQGRTKWVKKAEWWSPEMGREEYLKNAVEKAINGEPLGEKQESSIKALLSVLEDHEYGNMGADMTAPHRIGEEHLSEMINSVDPSGGMLETYRKALGTGKNGMIAKDGLHPDILGESLGYRSGMAMLNDIVRAPKFKDAVENLVDKKMMDKLGVVATPDAVEAAANESVSGMMRARVLATEYNALAKVLGKPSVLVQAAKMAAQRMVGKEKVGKLNPNLYASAEARAAKAADKAFKGGETAKAANEKRNQLVNNMAVRAAYEAKDEVEKGLKYVVRFSKDAARKRIDLDYRDQIDSLLDQYDFRRSSPRTIELNAEDGMPGQRVPLKDWAMKMVNSGYEIEFPDWVTDAANKRSYKDLSVDEFRGLMDSIKSIETVGKSLQSIRDGEKAIALEDAINEAKEQTRDMPDMKIRGNRGLTAIDEKLLGMKKLVLSADASLLKMEQMMDWLDNGKKDGIFNRIAFRRIADAEAKQHELKAKMVDKLKELNSGLGKEFNRSLSSDRFDIPELIDSQTKEPSVMTKKQVIAMALNTGNESNYSKMLRGEKWRHADVKKVLDRIMTPDDWKFVQGMWDAAESLWPETEAVERRLGNTVPDKIEARSMVNDKINGGYWPVMYDPERTFEVEQRGQKNADSLFENNYVRATTPKGHTKNRVDYAAPLWLSLDAFPRHVDQVIKDIAFREAVMDVDKFLQHPEIRDIVASKLGLEYYKQFRPWLQAIANDKVFDARGMAYWDKMAHTARTNATMVGLGYRLSTMLVHGSTAASNSVGEIGAKWFATGIRDCLGTPDKMRNARDFILERSSEMKNRMNEVDRDVREQLREMQVKQDSGAVGYASKPLNAARRFAYYGIAMLDMASAMPTWMGAYSKALHEGINEQDAIYYADKAVRNAHGGTGVKDLAAIQRGSETHKLFTMFYTFGNHYYNRQRDIGRGYAQVGRQLKQGDLAGARRDLPMLLARSLFYFVAPALIHGALKGQGPSQQEDEGYAEWAAKELVSMSFFGIPLGRDISNSIMRNGFTLKAVKDSALQTPAAQFMVAPFAPAVDLYNKLDGKDVSDKWLKHAIEAPGYVFGLPTGQISTSAQYLWDVGNGDAAQPDSASGWIKGLSTGKQ